MAELYKPIRIQWNLTDSCNFSCEYCPDILKSGNTPLPDPEIFCTAFFSLYNQFDKFELNFLGGEPTTYIGLDRILEKIEKKSDNKKIILETNGSKDLAWWVTYGSKVNCVIFSYHANSLNLEKMLDILAVLKNYHLELIIKLPTTEKTWDETLKTKELLSEKNYNTTIQLLYKNYTKGNNKYYDYTEEQLNFYYKNKNIVEEKIPEQIEHIRVHKLNDYYGHLCWAGIDQFVIDRYGDVYRGWCSQGGKIGNIYSNPIIFPQDPILCQKSLCTNGFDLEARKSKNSWGRL